MSQMVRVELSGGATAAREKQEGQGVPWTPGLWEQGHTLQFSKGRAAPACLHH